MTRHLLILIALIELTLLLAAIGLAIVRERERRRPSVLLDILPPEGASADRRSWKLFYQGLYAISHPWWKRRLFGQPSIVLELWSQDGDLGARCWAPARLERMVTILLRGAIPGAQLQPSSAQIDLPSSAARARLRLDIDEGPQYTLGQVEFVGHGRKVHGSKAGLLLQSLQSCSAVA